MLPKLFALSYPDITSLIISFFFYIHFYNPIIKSNPLLTKKVLEKPFDVISRSSSFSNKKELDSLEDKFSLELNQLINEKKYVPRRFNQL